MNSALVLVFFLSLISSLNAIYLRDPKRGEGNNNKTSIDPCLNEQSACNLLQTSSVGDSDSTALKAAKLDINFSVTKIPYYENEQYATDIISRISLINPKVSLFFSGYIPSSRKKYDMIYRHIFKNPLPTDIYTVTGLVAMYNDDFADPSSHQIGLFLPETSNVNVTHVESVAYPGKNISPDTFFKQLLPKNEAEDFTLMVFLPKSKMDYKREFDFFMKKMKEYLGTRFNENEVKFSLWGGVTEVIEHVSLKKDSYSRNIFQTSEDYPHLQGVSLSGRGVRSWSIVINNDSNEDSQIADFEEFKKKVHIIPGKSVALVLQSTSSLEYTDQRLEKVENFKKIFPDIPLINFGIRRGNPKFCINSTKKDSELEISFGDQFLCYLIITYQ